MFEGVKVDESKWNTKGRNIILNIKKANEEAEYWPRLTKEKTKNTQIQIDWSRWIDEDDEGQEEEGDYDGMDMNSFGQHGGHDGHFHGQDDSDDDEEEEEVKEEKKKTDLSDLDEEVKE